MTEAINYFRDLHPVAQGVVVGAGVLSVVALAGASAYAVATYGAVVVAEGTVVAVGVAATKLVPRG